MSGEWTPRLCKSRPQCVMPAAASLDIRVGTDVFWESELKLYIGSVSVPQCSALRNGSKADPHQGECEEVMRCEPSPGV